MKNRKYICYGLFVIIGLFLCGCATIYEQYEDVEDADPAVRRFVSLHQIQKGLTSEEVKVVLGDQVIIGYEMPDARKKRYKPIVITNPYRVENYDEGRRSYVIEYYFVGINLSDGEITDDELTPLVFEDGILSGWGWDFLKRIKG